MPSYTKKQIVSKTGLTPRQVQLLTEEGIISREKMEDLGIGRGKVRRYSKDNLLEFLLCKELLGYGIRLNVIEYIMWYVSKDPFPSLTKTEDSYLVIERSIDGWARTLWSRVNERKKKCVLESAEMGQLSGCVVINFSRLQQLANEQ